MKVSSARRLRFIPACILAAATVVAMATPGVASAALGKQCSGASIVVQGASVEKLAQQNVWDPDFNTSAAKYACNGTQGTTGKPTIKYESTSSGAGLESWGEFKHAASFGSTNAFIGTSEAPSASQIAEIEANESKSTPETVETIPVVQLAIAVIVNLPEGCVANSKSNAGRLVLNDSTLEGIFQGTITKWSQITENADKVSAFTAKVASVTTTTGSATVTVASGGFPGVVAGMKVTGTGIASGATVASVTGDEVVLSKNATKTGTAALTFTSVTCNPEATITPVVREDQAGTTHILKRYLGLIDPGSFEVEGGATKTWDEISEGALNTTWPTLANVVRPAKKGDAEEAAKVAATPSSIGYGNLAEIRSAGEFSKTGVGGPKTQKFWVPIQNKAGEESYADPASNKDTEAAANANCAGTVYTNGPSPFPPPAVTSPWNEVTTSLTESKYTLCNFTYVLALQAYSAYPETTLEEATTVNNFLRFTLETTTDGGQKLIANHDYLALPSGEVQTVAQKGAAKIAF